MIKCLIGVIGFIAFCNADVIHVLEPSTPPPPPKPYAFGYAAGRFAGHIDRTHSEVSDGSGVVQGSYSYVDPKFQIRTVEYTADKDGFHPVLSQTPRPLPKDTHAVEQAKARHFEKYNAIAASHQAGVQVATVPRESQAVLHAKAKHLNLFQKIAEEHARIAAERKALGIHEEEEEQHYNGLQH